MITNKQNGMAHIVSHRPIQNGIRCLRACTHKDMYSDITENEHEGWYILEIHQKLNSGKLMYAFLKLREYRYPGRFVYKLPMEFWFYEFI